LLPRRGWLVLVSRVRVIILLLLPKAWVAPRLPDPVRVPRLDVRLNLVVHELRSSSEQALRVALEAHPVLLVLAADPVAHALDPLVEDAPVLAVVVAVPAEAQQELLVAVAARANPASPSGPSAKSMKCARLQALAVSRSPGVMVQP
jgi:hypothetical protein